MKTDYHNIASQARKKVLSMIYNAQTSHIGSNFSIIDILAVLFSKLQKQDKIILSAGWKAASFYYFLAEAGFFPKEDLDTYCQPGSKLIGLTEPGVNGVHFAGGSMQMGIPAAVGFTVSKKMKGEEGKVYCIMSDGELAGGMLWESLIIASHHKLDNLVLIVDRNKLQAMGPSDEILDISCLQNKFWNEGITTININGHNYDTISGCIDALEYQKKPTVIFAHTIKGKGWERAEGDNTYHYKNISKEEYEQALKELC